MRATQRGLLADQRKEAEPQAQISGNLFVLTAPQTAPRVRVATPQSLCLQKPTCASNPSHRGSRPDFARPSGHGAAARTSQCQGGCAGGNVGRWDGDGVSRDRNTRLSLPRAPDLRGQTFPQAALDVGSE